MKKARSLPCPKSLILLVEQRGIEPLTSALRTRRSAKLSYCPTKRENNVSGSRFQGRTFQVSGFKLAVSGFKFQVSGFRFQVSSLRFQGWTFQAVRQERVGKA